MTIRLATQNDAEIISELVIAAARPNKDLDFDDLGWARFTDVNAPALMRGRICDGRHFTLCYTLDNRIVGIITIRDYEKIDQLFVHPAAWNRQIARQLWQAARSMCFENGSEGRFWVRSSTMAVPVYRKMGFVTVGDRQVRNGITFQCMVLKHADGA